MTSSNGDNGSFALTLASAIEEANVPTLQMLCVQLTGDERWLSAPYEPTRCKGVDDNDSGGLPDAVQDEIRRAAYEAVLAWRAGKPVALPHISSPMLLRMMRISVGEQIPADYADLMAAKFESYVNPAGENTVLTTEVPEDFSVLIIGAGMSGLALGVRLSAAGIPFTIIEKASEVGGTWNQHNYPGCGVDTPGHLYSFSFTQHRWDHYFPKRNEVHDNYRRIADEFAIRGRIRFNTEVVATRYDEEQKVWRSELRSPDGRSDTVVTPIVVTAVGAFGAPKWPAIPGLNDFQGPLVHTAGWDDSVELKNKRVGVIGNGASSMQLVNTIVDDVESLTVYQRSKQWAAPFPKMHKPIPEGVKFLFREVPLYEWWYRLRLSWIFDSKVYDSLQRDPEWNDPDRSLNAINDGHRRYFTRYILQEIGDRKDLAEKLIPDFPPYGKRMLLDHGWYRTMTRPNVELIDNPIERIDANGIWTADGTHRDLDVIVAASGYDVARFLSPVEIYGRQGKSIRDAWDDDNPKAYLGTVTPDFPNFFMLFGPNTSLGHGGSFIFITECQVSYIMSVMAQMLEGDIDEVEIDEKVSSDYNDLMDTKHKDMIWTHPGMSTYYRNSRGRVVMNSPWKTVEFWRFTRHANMEEFVTKSRVPVS